jgi:hypothetical protein
MKNIFIIFDILILLFFINCSKEIDENNPQKENTIKQEKINTNKSTNTKIDLDDLNRFINSFLNGDIKNINDDKIINDLMIKYYNKELVFEGLTYGALPLQFGIIIKENKKDSIIVSAYCLFKNDQTIGNNEKVKIKGTLDTILISGDPIGNIILNFHLKDCEIIK